MSRYKMFVSSDNQFGFKRDLSYSDTIYTVNSVVNEYCGILLGGILSGSPMDVLVCWHETGGRSI